MAPLHISLTELHGYQLFARFLIDAFFFVRNFKMLPTIFYKTIKKKEVYFDNSKSVSCNLQANR